MRILSLAFSILFISAIMISVASSQQNLENPIVKNITGTVMGTDTVGSTISIQTKDQKQMAFFVPDRAIITQDAQNIGFMDINESSFVTIQYFVSPGLKNTVLSIVDNDPVLDE